MRQRDATACSGFATSQLRHKTSQTFAKPISKSWITSTFSQRNAMRCDTKPYHCGKHNMSPLIPYRSVVRVSAVVPLSYPNRTPINGCRAALPRERHHLPLQNCQVCSFPQSVSRGSFSSINRAVAFAARRGPLHRAFASRSRIAKKCSINRT